MLTHALNSHTQLKLISTNHIHISLSNFMITLAPTFTKVDAYVRMDADRLGSGRVTNGRTKTGRDVFKIEGDVNLDEAGARWAYRR